MSTTNNPSYTSHDRDRLTSRFLIVAMSKDKFLPLLSAGATIFLIGGWSWPWMYTSRYEAQKACKQWAESGPKRTKVQWEYRIRLKDTTGQETWKDYGLKFSKARPVPGEWSPPLTAKQKSEIPKPLPNEEIESWKSVYTLPVRKCISEIETRQVLGTEQGSISKRFKY